MGLRRMDTCAVRMWILSAPDVSLFYSIDELIVY